MISFSIQFGLRSTSVLIDPGLISMLGPQLKHALPRAARVLVITDDHVASLYAEAAAASLQRSGWDAELFIVPSGEASKSLSNASAIYDRLAQGRYSRDSAIIAVGGGVVSDLAGFVAATWMRGIGFVICPTTLEAAVDASVGGKTAVNHPAGKNLIGAFHQPQAVMIDPICLATLPDRDIRAGLAESIKHGAIRDPEFLVWHEDNREAILAKDPAIMAQLIEKNVRIKADVVAADEREQSGIRASLNFGHTIGHAIEAWAEFDLRHGECVSLGMVAACQLSVDMGLLGQADAEQIRRILVYFGLPVQLPNPPMIQPLLEFIALDKKAANKKVRFVLLDGIGQTVMRDDVAPEQIILAIQTILGP